MCRNLRKLLASLAVLSLLAGCSAQTGETAQLLTQAQQEQGQRKLTQVQVDDLERTTPGLLACRIVYVRDEKVLCSGLDGYVMQRCEVSSGDVVKEGQTLAWFAKPADPRTLESLENAVQAAEYELRAAREAAERAVTAAETALNAASGSAQKQICQIRLDQAKTAAAAVSDRALKQAQRALEDYQLAVQGKPLVAPFDGTVEGTLRLDGQSVSSATEFCRLYTHDRIFLRADGVNEVAYRYGASVKISRAGKYFCDGTVISSMDVYGVVNGTVIVQLEPEASVEELTASNMGITLSAVRMQLEDVLLLPKEAIRHDAGEFYVYLYENDTLCRRYVQLGAEGKNSQGEACQQIVDGLKAGDWVIVD